MVAIIAFPSFATNASNLIDVVLEIFYSIVLKDIPFPFGFPFPFKCFHPYLYKWMLFLGKHAYN